MTNLSTTSTNTFRATGAIQTVTVAVSGYYDITADGAQGGSGAAAGGLGAMATGEVYLTAGSTLEIIVGSAGSNGSPEGSGSYDGGGGGGGSFVIETSTGGAAVDINEVIAGGGGGGSNTVGASGLGIVGGTAHGGAGGSGASSGGGGGGGGGGGDADGVHGGGSGTAPDQNIGNGTGSGSAGATTGSAFSGGTGFSAWGLTNAGGFGGGGGGGAATNGGGGGGGGGGYIGGAGGHGAFSWGAGGTGGGGGTSYVSSDATNVSSSAGVEAGNGLVTIAYAGVACYCRGTAILTAQGEVAVEDLAIGDLVVTASGARRPIKWLGKRSYAGRFALGRKHIQPICFAPGSLGDNAPSRALWVSPEHAMFLDGVLIPAKALVDGQSVTQAENIDRIDYFHIELDSHDVIIANGALSETFVDDQSRAMFQNAADFAALYGDEEQRLVRFCAPRHDEGHEVEAARAGIALRSGRAGNDALSQTGALRGHIDTVSATQISGWAQNVAHPQAPVCLDVLCDGHLIGHALANVYRADLERAGIGEGRQAFVFTAPPGINLAQATIEVRRSLDGAKLRLPVAVAA